MRITVHARHGLAVRIMVVAHVDLPLSDPAA